MLLNKVTHFLLVMSQKRAADSTGVHGVLFLCFGSDDDCIAQIHLVKAGDRFGWRVPHIDVRSNTSAREWKLPVFKGLLAQEVTELSRQAYDILKTQLGKARYGHKYRIAAGKAIDETNER